MGVLWTQYEGVTRYGKHVSLQVYWMGLPDTTRGPYYIYIVLNACYSTYL